MASVLQQYHQLADRMATQITGSYQSWTDFLTTAARLYKYPYHEQLMTLMVRNHNTGGNTMCKIRSIKQAADYFKQLDPETQITEYTLRKLIADGTIPSIKTGNKHLVNLDQVLSLFEPVCVTAVE